MEGHAFIGYLNKVKHFILDSEWNDECIEFTMMCVFFYFCVCHHLKGQLKTNRILNNTNNTNVNNKTSNTNLKPKSPKTPANSDNKRNHSSSSSSEPLSSKLLKQVTKKLFVNRNRFDVLKPMEPTEETFETITQGKQSIADPDPVLTYSKPPPQIFI